MTPLGYRSHVRREITAPPAITYRYFWDQAGARIRRKARHCARPLLLDGHDLMEAGLIHRWRFWLSTAVYRPRVRLQAPMLQSVCAKT